MFEADEAPSELRALYDALLAERGAVPNMFKTVAHVPPLAIGFAALLRPLLSDGALAGWYKELVATRIAVLLGSSYAIVAHSLSAQRKGAGEGQIEAVQADFERGPFTEEEKLGFRCAERIHQSGDSVDDEFFDRLKRAFSAAQIVELVATAAAFEFFPRFVDALRIPTTAVPQKGAK
jgi:alkylhydroperoxidase family enzyme